ncbi:MAG: pyrroline-5-carboxylate reductase [Flavobacteriaceae bacterium]|nr:pyrroline-5-carboxylate reductase [Flavobacteriaceae bacterium]
MNSRELVVIGCGNMGSAIIKAILKQGIIVKEKLIVIEKTPNKFTEDLKSQKVAILSSLSRLNSNIKTVILAVKPQAVKETLNPLSVKVDKNSLVISIMAGVTVGFLKENLPKAQIVRTMPNTPCSINQGMTAYFGDQNVTEESFEFTKEILESIGEAVKVDDENLMDAVTAISGSGPAYVFYLAEALNDAALQMGLNAEQSKILSRQTMLGASSLLANSSLDAKKLRENVTSKGGTTEAAIKHFNEMHIKENMIDAFKKAWQKSIELGKS